MQNLTAAKFPEASFPTANLFTANFPRTGSYSSTQHGLFEMSQVRSRMWQQHAGALHELYVRSRVGSGNRSSESSNVLDIKTRGSSSEDKQPIVRKLPPNHAGLLCTSAVRVINPQHLKMSNLVYAQLSHRQH